ncbi:MAG: hypothetical protein U5K84_01315 [Alkalibacterium sp.]|nr:hypothetical protein [Alkalibacterium sp.]
MRSSTGLPSLGYYPLDVADAAFQTRFEEGYFFCAHYLLIEQGYNYLKESGYAFYLLPTNVFESEEVKHLLKYVHSSRACPGHYPYALRSGSSSSKIEKVICLCAKRADSRQVSEVLVSTVPSLNDQDAFRAFCFRYKKMEKRAANLKRERLLISKTIAINAGSSSLKWKLFKMPEEQELASGVVERIGLNDSIFTIKLPTIGERYKQGRRYC